MPHALHSHAPHSRRAPVRAAAALGLAALLLATGAASASAHVHVTPDVAEPGSYATLTFQVPNESETASTTKVEVTLPTDTPFTYVAYEPVDGWKATITTSKLDAPVRTDAGATITEAPTKVVWTADDADDAIAPGQFRRFTISAGAVPETGSVLLPTTQTYSDGTVVRWDEPTPASGEEPEHPAPTLYVTSAPPAEGGHGGASDAPTVTSTDGSTGAAAGASGSGGSSGGGLAAFGIVLGAIGAVTGGAALALARRGATPTAGDPTERTGESA